MTLATAIDRYVAEHLQPKTKRPGTLNTYIIYLGMIRDAWCRSDLCGNWLSDVSPAG
jgi:hypothetical protein